MKLALALLLSAPCGAFVAPSSRTPLTVSFGAYDDAVAEALAATQQYGFTSGEAKTARVPPRLLSSATRDAAARAAPRRRRRRDGEARARAAPVRPKKTSTIEPRAS